MSKSYPANLNPAALKLIHILIEDLNNSRILELGCNTGALGEYFKRKYPHQSLVWQGADYNKTALLQASRRIDSCFYCDLNKLTPSLLRRECASTPDIIVMIDTLEHLTDPGRVLSSILTVFPGSKLVVILPNISCLSILDMICQSRFDYQKYGITDNTHLRFFTLSSALKFFNIHGYRQLHHVEWLIDPSYASLLMQTQFPFIYELSNAQITFKSPLDVIEKCSYGFGIVLTPLL